MIIFHKGNTHPQLDIFPNWHMKYSKHVVYPQSALGYKKTTTHRPLIVFERWPFMLVGPPLCRNPAVYFITSFCYGLVVRDNLNEKSLQSVSRIS